MSTEEYLREISLVIFRTLITVTMYTTDGHKISFIKHSLFDELTDDDFTLEELPTSFRGTTLILTLTL